MPVTPTYPGIYIEELPSNARVITAAPTSITVFVGYTHPLKTRRFNTAARLFSFTDYEREFGGLYSSSMVDANVAYAVNQFFLNGGSDAYVVGLRAQYRNAAGGVIGPMVAETAAGSSIAFTALEPVDSIPMTVTINNLQNTPANTADIFIAYGSRSETYRRVNIVGPADANFIERRINGVSSLVRVAPVGGGPNYATPIAPAGGQTITLATTPPAGFASTFSAGDFNAAFGDDSSLDKVPIFNLMAVPGVADNGVWSEALAFCERKRAFLILDPPRNTAADSSGALPAIENQVGIVPKSTNGALYFPYLRSLDPLTAASIELPPSGFVAGLFARTDQNRGVWKAPAGLETTILNTPGVVERGRMTDMRQGVLNQLGVNALRDFPGVGTVIFGARTLVTQNSALQQWRYVPVRRMALFIEQTLYANLGWVVFEPNDEPLWVAIRTTIDDFMLSLFRQGAFQGATPSQAFRVVCDSSTTTQTDIDNGIVNIIVAFRPLKPAEFVIVKISQLAGQASA